MLSFECDYNTGAHPSILEALVKTNLDPQPGYGNDIYSASAKEKIRKAIQESKRKARKSAGKKAGAEKSAAAARPAAPKRRKK